MTEMKLNIAVKGSDGQIEVFNLVNPNAELFFSREEDFVSIKLRKEVDSGFETRTLAIFHKPISCKFVEVEEDRARAGQRDTK